MSTRHRRKPREGSGEPLHVAICIPCGNKRSYLDRPTAKTVARQMPGSGHMTAFPCPHAPVGRRLFHIGHLPARVRNGTVDKSRYLNGTPPVRIDVEEDGMAVQVTYRDPRDAARLCDALLVAADDAAQKGNRSLMRRYIELANNTADALDRTDLPAVNDSPATLAEVGAP